ncbi:SGNH/GDSL hydrolase family protein [Acinetobacter sp. ANC 4648]|uniref:SGNH/GDSL hydrolase family protein n=1 Tax=Acinetobacter sp. ANC 4648 TaxID=1977875 RepID=UPI000A35AA33|nr:SGNH/GDSL hydrolase family protein [Acinetobacter sp. ANC 4648]OTG80289.1 lipase [Acinetobacter sp. ANC 4648]
MFLKLSTIALIPALIVQGYLVKKNTPRLPEPKGERCGVIGQGHTLSILILGDSAAAGVGVQFQEQALLGSILSELKHQFKISYQLQAKTGDTTIQVIQNIQSISHEHFDVVITSVGVNDVTKLTDPKRWIKQQHLFYAEIEQCFSPKLVLATGVPPMNLFPALPNPLSWLFGQYSQQMNNALAKFIQKKAMYQLIQFDLAKFNSLNLDMAEDGFHPSQEIYQLWGQEVAEKIRQNFLDKILMNE